MITTKVLHSILLFQDERFKKKNRRYILILKKRARFGPKTAIFMRPKWPHLAKNKLYDIKLQKYTRLIAKNGMIWRIGSSFFKILEP